MIKKNHAEERIEINPFPSMIGQNDQNQSNKLFNFNPKPCGRKGSHTQPSQETPNSENLIMQSTLISKDKRKISPKIRRECNQKITVAETKKGIKSFENNESASNNFLQAEIYKTFMKYFKQAYISCTLKLPN